MFVGMVVGAVAVVAMMVGTVCGYGSIDTVAGAEIMNAVEVGDADARDSVCFVGGRGGMAGSDTKASHDNDHSWYHTL